MDPSAAIAAIRDSRPPATDRFTYLTIVESNLSPAVLPALNEILQDAELTQEIGWDLVYNLVNLPDSDACLETIARLGNPREVILKVLETLELLQNEDDGYQSDDEEEERKQVPGPAVTLTHKFITLLGVLAILHRRIKTKYPSRFLAQTLQTVLQSYRPNQEMTAAVINLVHSLSGRRRPPLPSRKSSVNVANPDQDGDASKNAPDPEADKDEREDPSETAMQQRLLLSFVTCILEAYANGNEMAWAARLLEYYNPDKIVPGKKTLMAAFREDQELLARDSIVGSLVALIADLGLNSCSKKFVQRLRKGLIGIDPLAGSGDAKSPEDIHLSTGGCVCLVGYWVFSSTVFDADQPTPDAHIFPEHYDLLQKTLEVGGDVEAQIQKSVGAIEAIVAIGLWLHANDRISEASASPVVKPTPASTEGPTSEFMSYLHLVTLIALYHPRIQVRNAASTLAGLVLHSNPADDDRLRILYDLLENCAFASLKARAVTWLREEFLAAAAPPPTWSSTSADPPANSSVFSEPQALETVQYVVFPNQNSVKELEPSEIIDYLAWNMPFLLQSVNFGLFLWSSDRWKHVLPANLDATVKERWFEPLRDALDKLESELKPEGGGELAGQDLGPLKFDLDVLRERMARLEGADGFRASEIAEKA
ncbi:YAP-binding/ALF4/Glomulin [Podospora appendiculata]|uniref:YAP-binding/ALF4/Glomulin n=1 Tax=Podospora appendiculata TaxID=314037 RepID=A0AAE0XG53_9PEZI|nr:YAP-binding/ALF4/Glomulin [Podospora appendiculata]